MPPPAALLAMARRFVIEEDGGAGLDYVLFATCWGVTVSAAMYLTGNVMTGPFDSISAALDGRRFEIGYKPFR